jgi:hypothetical protein
VIIQKRWSILLMSFIALLGACTNRQELTLPEGGPLSCHIIYDAGSHGTRLYVYQQTASGWIKNSGPKTGALADPVRRIRGKTITDTGAVVDEVVDSLENMRHDGPSDDSGIPLWLAFDWRERCNIESVSVYGTAGMRLAEQKDPEGSKRIWDLLNAGLSVLVDMDVETRTLSGYEEGLYAWLAKREERSSNDFGIVEMGGASVQVTFPCSSCGVSRRVKVKGRRVPVYSHSFLGWGQDEAFNKFGTLPACKLGAGIGNPQWNSAECAAGMKAFSDVAVDIRAYVTNAGDYHWYLTDAFRYMRDDDIEQFCLKGVDTGYEPPSACFRAVYLLNVIEKLGLPADSEISHVDWTLGAVVCNVTRCLETR